MVGTHEDQSLRKGMKSVEQLARERRSVPVPYQVERTIRTFPCDYHPGKE